jgi:glycosyltransferase involved in cell wall biosynthesis
MIDLIVPAYNANSFISNLLYSVAAQTISNLINVVIVDDCSKKNYDDIVEKFKNLINIQVVRTKKNCGPGAARQLGLENSNSKYVVFSDADDIFYNCFSIETLYNTIENENKDVVSANFFEEIPNGSYLEHGENAIWLHGKIYRRQFIKDHDMFFNDTRANEDTGFNKLALLFSDFYYISDYVYIWKCNNTSITRSTNYGFYGLEGFCYNICWSIYEGEKRGASKERMASILYEAFVDLYYRYIYYKDEKDRDLILDWAKDLKQLFLKYENDLSYDKRKAIIFKVINFLYHAYLGPEGFLNNDLTFNHFIELIK